MTDHTMKKTISEYLSPAIGDCMSSIVSLVVEVKKFELDISLIQLVLQNQCGGLPFEDPHLHIASFL